MVHKEESLCEVYSKNIKGMNSRQLIQLRFTVLGSDGGKTRGQLGSIWPHSLCFGSIYLLLRGISTLIFKIIVAGKELRNGYIMEECSSAKSTILWVVGISGQSKHG